MRTIGLNAEQLAEKAKQNKIKLDGRLAAKDSKGKDADSKDAKK